MMFGLFLMTLFIQCGLSFATKASSFVQTGRLVLIDQGNSQALQKTYNPGPVGSTESLHQFQVILQRIAFSPRISIVLSIVEFSIEAPQGFGFRHKLNLEALQSTSSASSFQVTLQLSQSNYQRLLGLSIMYMAIDRQRSPWLYHLNQHQLAPIPSGSSLQYFFFQVDNPLTFISSINKWIFIKGYCYTAPYSPFMHFRTQVINIFQNSFKVQLELFANTLKWVKVYVVIAYNPSNYNTILTQRTQIIITFPLMLTSWTFPSNQFIIGIQYVSITQTNPPISLGFLFNELNQQIQQKQVISQMQINYMMIQEKDCEANYYSFKSVQCVFACEDNRTIFESVCNYIPFCDNYTAPHLCLQCQNNYYPLAQSCQRYCHQYPYCQKCNDLQCLMCNKTQFTDFNSSNQCACVSNSDMNEDNSTCVCRKGFYGTVNGYCQLCDPTCYTCEDTSTKCTSCYGYQFRSLNTNNKCQCAQQFQLQGSNCVFSSHFLLQLNTSSILKDPYNNLLTFQINIKPDLQIFNEIDFTQMIFFELSSPATFLTRYSQGVLTVEAYYQSHIQDPSASFEFNIKQFNTSFYQTFSSVLKDNQTFDAIPANDLEPIAYSQEYYRILKFLDYPVYFLVGLSAVTFIIGSYSSKVVVTEMMTILQLSYFGLFTISSQMAMYLRPFKYFNGFSDILSSSQGQLPKQIFQKGYSPDPMLNKNILTLIEIIPFVISLIYFIISKNKRHGGERMAFHSKLFLGEWAMLIALFSFSNVGASTALFFMHFNSDSPYFILDILEIVFNLGLVIFVFVIYGVTDYNYCGEFKYSFQWNKISLNYYYIQMVIKLISPVILVVISDALYSLIIVLVLFLVVGVFTILAKPYADKLQTARSVFNFIIGCLIFGLYILMNTKALRFYSFVHCIPFVITILLYLVTLTSLGFVIKQFKQTYEATAAQKAMEQKALKTQQQKHADFMKNYITASIKNENSDNNISKRLHQKKSRPKKKRKISMAGFEVDAEKKVQIDRELVRGENIEEIMRYDLDAECPEMNLQKFKRLDQMLRGEEYL